MPSLSPSPGYIWRDLLLATSIECRASAPDDLSADSETLIRKGRDLWSAERRNEEIVWHWSQASVIV